MDKEALRALAQLVDQLQKAVPGDWRFAFIMFQPSNESADGEGKLLLGASALDRKQLASVFRAAEQAMEHGRSMVLHGEDGPVN